jgi:hypothetical protein
MNQAVKSLSEYFEGAMPKDLSKFIKKNIVNKQIEETLACNYYLIQVTAKKQPN